MATPFLVLLVEEDPAVASTFEVILNRINGVQMIWFDVPALVIHQIDSLKPDLILLRPDPSLTFLSTIKALLPDTSILAYAPALTDPEALLRANQPFDDLLTWPTTHTTILSKVKNLLRSVSHSGSFEPLQVTLSQSILSSQHPLSLHDHPFEEILWQTWITRFCGQLSVEHSNSRRVLSFINGFPVWAVSNIASEALGHMLVQRGLFDRTRLQSVLAKQQSTNLTLGQLLINEGLLSPTQLREVLDEQVRERILSCFELRTGRVDVFPASQPSESTDLFIQNPLSIIQLGLSRLRDLSPLHSFLLQMASQHVVPSQYFSHQVPYFELGLSRRSILSQIDGWHTLAQLQQQWVGPERTFIQFFWTLYATHTIFLSPHPIPSRPQSLDALLLDREHLLRLMASAPGQRQAPSPMQSGQSGTFRAPDPEAQSTLSHLLLLPPAVLASLDYFTLFGLDIDANPYQIHGRIRNTLHLLDALELNPSSELDIPQLQALSHTLRTAAAILLDVGERRVYRAQLAPVSSQRLEQARQLLELNHTAEAAALLEELDALDPVNPQITTLLAACIYRRFGTRDRMQLARAQALLARAIALDEHNADAFHLLGCIEHDLQDTELARRAWQRAIAIDPGHLPTQDALRALSPS